MNPTTNQTSECACGNADGTNDECERCQFIARIAKLENFVRDVRDNYDCDDDGHKYNTGCRCCAARQLMGDPPLIVDRCSTCGMALDDDGTCQDCYVSPEVQKRNDAMERAEYLRDRDKDEAAELKRGR